MSNRGSGTTAWFCACAIAVTAWALVAASPSSVASGASRGEHWVSTWATAQQLTPIVNPTWVKPPPKADVHSPILPAPEHLKDETVRMIVRTTVGGAQVRLQLSNALGYAPIIIGSTHIAVQDRGSSIVAGTDRAVTFGGQGRVKIPPGAVMVSDPVDLPIRPLMRLAISLYVPGPVAQLTTHQLGLHTTYVSPGDASASQSLPGARENSSYFWLTGVDVKSGGSAQTIVAFGDSITDGYATTPNADRAWPSRLFERTRESPLGTGWSIVNLGISGNRVLHDGTGTNALARFDRDVLSRPGVRWIIFLEGINDISFPAIPGAPEEDRITAEDLIAGYRAFIENAHLHGIRIMGGTLLPWEGVWTFTSKGEAIRQQVNEWIRTGGAFDRVVDFDAVTRDPAHPTRLKPEYDSGDHVHPNDAGNHAMADAIDLSVFNR